MAEGFTVSLSGNVEMSVKEVWPDGDAPDNPTAEDVVEQMKREGTIPRMLENWNLLWDIEVDVTDEDSVARWWA